MPLEALALIPSAFFAGVLMFLAPCTLPIVPGYLAFIAGIPESAAQARGARKRIVWNALAFVIGFSIVFILLGIFASLLGSIIGPWRDTLGRFAGIILIIFGLTMLGIVRIPALSSSSSMRLPNFIVLGRWEKLASYRSVVRPRMESMHRPILGTILLYASTSSTTVQGGVLLAFFSLGLGVPFIITALFLEKVSKLLSHLTLLVKFLSIMGGVGLIVVGGLMVFGEMAYITSGALEFFDWLYTPLLKYM